MLCNCWFQVKVDAKTKILLDDWRAKKKKKAEKKEAEKKEEKQSNGDSDDRKEEGETTSDEREDLDEFTLREDRVAKAGLDAIMREYAFELAKQPSTKGSSGSCIFLLFSI